MSKLLRITSIVCVLAAIAITFFGRPYTESAQFIGLTLAAIALVSSLAASAVHAFGRRSGNAYQDAKPGPRTTNESNRLKSGEEPTGPGRSVTRRRVASIQPHPQLPQLQSDAATAPTKFVVGNKSSSHLEVSTEPQADGTVKITVLAVGYTANAFKQRIRPRLENVKSIKWQHPTNLGDGKRQMEGVITGSPSTAIGAITGINA